MRAAKTTYQAAGVATLLCLLSLGALLAFAMQKCQGHLGYPMDDTYIHMAMAKNFSGHGVWGTTRYGFTSSTSSPFYTLLLAGCFLVTGIHEITPLILNLVAGTALLFWCDFILARVGFALRERLPLLAILVVAIPLPILILGGMEHTLHALLTLVFAHFGARSLSSSGRARYAGALFFLAAILVMTRYEAIFLIATAGLLFLVRGQWRMALGLAFAGALPVCVYGAISMQHGWFPLPTSLLLKANLPSTPASGMYPNFLLSLFRNVSRGSHIVMLGVIAGGLLYRIYRARRTVWTYGGTGTILFAATAVLHLILARTGWFFRYEAYLVALGVVACAVAFREVGFPAPRAVWTAALLLFGALIAARAGYAFYVAPQAVADIYDQQYQMGLFARENLNGKTLLINDIGAVSFLSDARVLDLIGLGSLDPAMARMQRRYSTEWLERWAAQNHAAAAIVYPNLAPPEWRPVANWRIPGNYMSGSDSVNFYALDPDFAQTLTNDLRTFRAKLPRRVVVR